MIIRCVKEQSSIPLIRLYESDSNTKDIRILTKGIEEAQL